MGSGYPQLIRSGEPLPAPAFRRVLRSAAEAEREGNWQEFTDFSIYILYLCPNMSEPKRIPQHVAIIMDGNGRWAGLHGKERYEGHAAGVEPVRASLRAAVRWG